MNTLTDTQSEFGEALMQALNHKPHRLSPKYLYDEVGSSWFARICELPEYHVTRTEMGILQTHRAEIARHIGPRADLIEFGAGSSRKIRLLLDALHSPARYCPVDISSEHLLREARHLQRDYPGLTVTPIASDILQPFELPAMKPGAEPAQKGQQVGLFLGSSLGNFDDAEIRTFLMLARLLLNGGALLIGVDLIKDPAMLHAAYNDASGVTAAFNLNVLARANRELGANFALEQFFHHACYRPAEQCVEMHLVSRGRQQIEVCGQTFTLAEGESLHTETSRKFTIAGLQSQTRECGWQPGPVWTDPQGWFALQWLQATETSS